MRPVIGITSDFNPGESTEFGQRGEATYFLRARYVQAIQDLGGVPLILPPAEIPSLWGEWLDRIDGLLITGSGPDLDPELYGETKRAPFKIMTAERARFELEIARLAVQKNRPVLGICGGLQVLNVALGGTLVQDIPTQIPSALVHRQETPATEPWHPVEIKPGTRLREILGRPTLNVNSSHHQSPGRVAQSLIINATASDGVIEGLEAPDRAFAIGVQWHPEFLYRKEKENERLFEAFLSSAAHK